MPIVAKPKIIPEKTLNKFWIAKFHSDSGIVGGAASLNATLIPYNEETQQLGDPIHLDAIDVFQEVQVDPQAAQIYGYIMAYLQKKAIEQGKLEAEEV
jgi:hypothetical protein